jgi:predicted Zn-dependent protease
MKKTVASLFVLACVVLLAGCSTVPIVGRKQVSLIPPDQMIAQSAVGYREVIAEGPLSANKKKVEQVNRVGGRIAAAVEQYFREQGQVEVLDGFEWEFHLIEEDVPNAWCMPGGKVAFYTGILPYTKDETGMAVVMGHEVAHAVAGHGRERASHQLLQMGGGYLASLLSQKSEYHEAIMQVYGLGTQVGGILPFSRLHESEADRLGLIFMAMAGYDPNAVVGFWQRMAAANSAAPPEFLSTHPADDTRIRQLRAYMPEAMGYYRR